jgi:hypothetical protein
MIFLKRHRKYTTVVYYDICKEYLRRDIDISCQCHFSIRIEHNKLIIKTPYFAFNYIHLTYTPGHFVHMKFSKNAAPLEVYFIIRPSPDCEITIRSKQNGEFRDRYVVIKTEQLEYFKSIKFKK